MYQNQKFNEKSSFCIYSYKIYNSYIDHLGKVAQIYNHNSQQRKMNYLGWGKIKVCYCCTQYTT